MSSELGTNFGQKHRETYAEVLDAWANTAAGKKVSDAMAKKWGKDLYEALAEDLIKELSSKDALALWSGVKLPSKETLIRYSQIAAKYSLQYATRDLLDRLIKSADFNKENPETVVAAGTKMRPQELAKRAPQTVAQIFDMAKDKFSEVLVRSLTKKQEFTGERRWETVGKDSRHSSLHHEIKGPDEDFSFKNEKIAAPRPVGGAPESWSNCSCRLSYRTTKGKWITP